MATFPASVSEPAESQQHRPQTRYCISDIARRRAQRGRRKAVVELDPYHWNTQLAMASALQLRMNSLGLADKRSRSSASPTALTRPSSSLSRDHERFKSNGSQSGQGLQSLDLTPQLQRSVLSAVKARSGSVLSRGFILKTDHYPSGASIARSFTRLLCSRKWMQVERLISS